MSYRKIEKNIDNRGWLAEILKAKDLKKKKFGQIFITVAKPGITKGGHYHKRKREFFCVIKGSAILTLQKITPSEEIITTEKIEMGEDKLMVVEIEPYNLHYILNNGKEDMYLLVYTDEEFNPKDTDTYMLKNEKK
ncbi:MAG: WxcM-like domain-containing protein [Candidatus Woesearchaeota archaeon]